MQEPLQQAQSELQLIAASAAECETCARRLIAAGKPWAHTWPRRLFAGETLYQTARSKQINICREARSHLAMVRAFHPSPNVQDSVRLLFAVEQACLSCPSVNHKNQLEGRPFECQLRIHCVPQSQSRYQLDHEGNIVATY